MLIYEEVEVNFETSCFSTLSSKDFNTFKDKSINDEADKEDEDASSLLQ